MNSCYRRQAIAKHILPFATQLFLERSISIGVPIEPLKKVVDLNMGQSPRGASYNGDGFGMPFIGGPADLGRKYPQTRRWTSEPKKTCQLGDIIICVRATIGKPRWSDGEYCLGRGVAGLRPKSSRLNSRFLFRCLVNLEEELQSKGTGTTFKTVSKKHIEALPLPLPSPGYQEQIADYLDWLEARSETQEPVGGEPRLPTLFDKQCRIVARIEELATLIEEARELRVKAWEEAEALLKAASADAFGQLGVSDDQWVDLDDVTERITKGESPGWQGFSYVDDGPLFIRSENVRWGQLDLSSESRIQLAFHNKLSRSQLHGEDVLINLVGASIGRSAVVPDDLGEANVNQAVAVITPKQELDSRFLMLFLISPVAQRILHRGKVETARPNISLTDLRKLCLPVPSLDQQRDVVAHLDTLQAQVDELTALQDATQAELDALLPSVLDRAFRGEL